MPDNLLTQSEEVWKKISHPRAGLRYSVSSLGRIRRDDTGIIRKPFFSHHGYLIVDLWFENKRLHMPIHRAVAVAFISDAPSSKHEVDHKNEIKTDNRPDNLQWVDSQEHHGLTIGRGRMARGAQLPQTKLDESLVKAIRVCRDFGVPNTETARLFDMSVPAISSITRRITWRHVP